MNARVSGVVLAALALAALTACAATEAAPPTPTPSATTATAAGDSPDPAGTANPLPGDLRPATDADLIGLWVPAGTTSSIGPYLWVSGRNTFEAFEGCSEIVEYGQWAIGAGGEFSATNDSRVSMTCDTVGVADWVSAAERIGMDGDELVFVAPDGHELARMIRPLAVDAAWLDGGGAIGVVVVGAEACLLHVEESFASDDYIPEVHVRIQPHPAVDCARNAPELTVKVDTPRDVDAREDIRVSVTGAGVAGSVTLRAAEDLESGNDPSAGEISAGWATVPGRLVFVDNGEERCAWVTEVERAGDDVVVTCEPFDDPHPKYDDSPPLLVSVTGARPHDVDTLVLRSAGFDDLRVPIIAQTTP